MYVIKKKSFNKDMHFQYNSQNDTFHVSSTTKYAVIFVPVHQKCENKTFFLALWDSKMLVYAIKLAIAVDVADFS